MFRKNNVNIKLKLNINLISSEEFLKTIDNRDCSYKNTVISKSLGQVTLFRYIRITTL